MKKNYFILAATAITMMVSCADESYLGDSSGLPQENSSGAISFGSNAPAVTRATSSSDAAKIDYKFKVFGVKTVSSADQRVFATAASGVTPYDVWFVDATGNSTTSNSDNWEYVGSASTAYGTSGHTITLGAEQTIKYWDYNASEYNFQAWSDLNGTKINISAIDKNTMTLAGTPAQLANFWLADLATIVPSSTSPTTVQFTFRKAATKVRLGIYETIPGYKVRNVEFHYNDANNTAQSSTSNAILQGKFVGSSSSSETFGVSYDATSKRAVLTPSNSSSNTTFFDFGEFTTGTTTYLGEVSTSPTWANKDITDHYISVLPNTTSTNIDPMTLKLDYQLYNTVTQESINITGATAIVPAAYMKWLPNYAYTYLFKITDDKLTPITLDAIIIDADDGTQETITTVAEPSITTYAKASNVTVDGEYLTGSNIYAVVANGTALTVNTNAKLYTATIEDGAAQGITELTVANAIAQNTDGYGIGVVLASGTDVSSYYTYNSGTNTYSAASGTADGTTTYYPAATYSVKDANGKKLVINTATGLSAVTAIDADDAPDGAAITINGAKFTPAAPTFTAVAAGAIAAGTYYTAADGSTKVTLNTDGTATENQYWTKTASSAGYYVFEYTARDKATGTYVSGTTYYSAATGDTTVDTSSFVEGTTDVSSYYEGDPKKHYKVIKVVDKN